MSCIRHFQVLSNSPGARAKSGLNASGMDGAGGDMGGVNVAMIPLNAAQMNDFGNGNLVLGPPTQQNPGDSGQGFTDMSSGSGAGEFSVFNPFMDYSAAAAAAANMQVSVSGPGGGSVYDQQQQHQPQQQQPQQMNPGPFQMNPAGKTAFPVGHIRFFSIHCNVTIFP